MHRSIARTVGALILLVIPSLVRGQAGEEPNETAKVRTMSETIEVKNRVFQLTVTEAPSAPRDGEEVEFALKLTERVEGGFAAGEIPVENANVTIRILLADGKPTSSIISAHSEGGPGVYSVHHAFSEEGEYKISLVARTEDSTEIRADFPISVSAVPINYYVFVLDGFLLLITLGFLQIRYTRLDKQFSSSGFALKALAPEGLVTLTLLAGGILTAHYFIPIIQVRQEPQGSVAVAANESSEIVVPKETQVLFGIRTQVVQPSKIVSGVAANGIVRARPQFKGEVVVPVSGRTRWGARTVTVGDTVRSGEVIAVLENVLSASEVASLEATRTDLATKGKQLQSEATQAKQRLDLARTELERSRSLYDAGAAPLKRVQEAELAVKAAEEQYAAAQAGAQITGAGEERVTPVRTFPLEAPISGVITEVNFTAGQQVEAGKSLFTIMDLSRVWIEARVYEKDLAAVTSTRLATFEVPAFRGEIFSIGNDAKGKLLTVSPVVDPQTRTVSVIYDVANPGVRLRDGMFAEITIDTSGDREVLAVPQGAIVEEQGRKYVYVFLGGEHFEKRLVTLGAQGQEGAEILSGLKPGERVAIAGIYQLQSSAIGSS